MATTSLWRVHGWLGRLVVYVENPDKTENPKFFEHSEITEQQSQQLADVIEYAVNTNKTTAVTDDESEPIVQRFVTGVSVSEQDARNSMMRTKRAFKKTDGVVAYHGYQSFAPGEATPEIAHEIGVKLAKQLWGKRYQVLVATHLDKSSHLHNHFIINTVSFVDGKKFHRTNKDYYDMQQASDALCRDYGLSVIENPQRGKSKHYSEWNAERKGQPTYRSSVKNDIDISIRRSMTERQFFEKLHKLGYEIKRGKDISVRAFGKERFVRLKRSFGDDYSIEGIRRRILAQTRPEIPTYPKPQKTYRYRGIFQKPHRKAGLRALYFYYLIRLGHFKRKREPSHNLVYFIFREDIRFMRRISEETRLLVKHGIDTDKQLGAHKQELQNQINALDNQRRLLRNEQRSVKNDGSKYAIKNEISDLSTDMGALRREVKMCDEIEQRSKDMESKIQLARNKAKSERKEPVKDEQLRRRR